MSSQRFYLRTTWTRAAPVLVALFCVGCSGDSNMGAVTGRVTYGGKPLGLAQVEFTPEGSGRSSTGLTDTDGDYELKYTLNEKGAQVGRHKVRIVVMPPPGSPPINIPAEFGRESKLEFEVKPGANQFNIDIPGK
jgi:hypothetical protein